MKSPNDVVHGKPDDTHQPKTLPFNGKRFVLDHREIVENKLLAVVARLIERGVGGAESSFVSLTITAAAETFDGDDVACAEAFGFWLDRYSPNNAEPQELPRTFVEASADTLIRASKRPPRSRRGGP